MEGHIGKMIHGNKITAPIDKTGLMCYNIYVELEVKSKSYPKR